jgi:hypothetical protein
MEQQACVPGVDPVLYPGHKTRYQPNRIRRGQVAMYNIRIKFFQMPSAF